MPGIIYLLIPLYQDIRTMTISKSSIVSGYVFAILYLAYMGLETSIGLKDLISRILISLLLSVFLGIYGRDRVMGQGDGYILGIMALFYPPSIFMVMCFYAFLLSALCGLVVILIKRNKRVEYPFIPFIFSACILLLFI